MFDDQNSGRLVQTGWLTSSFTVRAIRKHWLLGLLVAIAVVASTAFYTVGQTKTYRATTTIQIDPSPPRPLGNQVQAVVDMGSGSYWNNKEYFTTQQKILEGRSIARETVRALNLHRDASFMHIERGRKPSREPDLEDATSMLMSRLSVESVRDSRLMNVSCVDSDPQRARRILTSMISIYLEKNVDNVVSSTGAASEWLREQVDKLKADLEHCELALHDYKKDKQILSVSLDDQSNMLRGEMQQLNEALTRTNAKREEVEARSRELDKIDVNDPSVLPATELLSNPLLNSLRQDYIQAKSELSGLLGEGKGERHPSAESAAARVDTTRQALLAEVRNIQGAVRGDLVAVGRESKGLAGLFTHAKKRAMDLNMLEIEYRRLERNKNNTEKLYGLVLERSKESDLTGMMRFNNISTIEAPTLPKFPYRPRVAFNLAIGLTLGIVLGLLVSTGRELLDRSIRLPLDVQSELDIPLIGTLPMATGQAVSSVYYSRRRRRAAHADPAGTNSPELLVHEAPRSNVAECARSIRTSLMFASPDRQFRRILVTSASPGEGKTTVACSVAIAFAQAGQKTLLLDCDLRRPRLHRIMHRENTAGLTNALQNPTEALSATIETQVPNLYVLTSGPHVPNPAEVVQSDAFGKLLDTLGQGFDKIVVDSPPILAVTDAMVIATRVDTTLLVARAGSSRRDVVLQVVRKLRGVGIPVVGLVLNALDPKRSGSGYYYHYPYYGYGKKYDSSSTESV
jgi:capsular exopolysaccharide synthesis family protein